jgi:hypothetical protein
MKAWIETQMQPRKWYPVQPERLAEVKRLIDERFGWDRFCLELNNDHSKVRKMIIFEGTKKINLN